MRDTNMYRIRLRSICRGILHQTGWDVGRGRLRRRTRECEAVWWMLSQERSGEMGRGIIVTRCHGSGRPGGELFQQGSVVHRADYFTHCLFVQMVSDQELGECISTEECPSYIFVSVPPQRHRLDPQSKPDQAKFHSPQSDR